MNAFFSCLKARRVNYKKGDVIIEAGTVAAEFGILLEGSAHSIKWDASGKQIIITMVEKGGAIGVLLAASPQRVSPLTVQATADATVLMFPFSQIITGCEKKCRHHERLLQNYISIIADKGIELHERVNCLLEPTVRKKILTYLTNISHEQNSTEFILPINRNIMAEYLNVERSALSRELSRMKADGLIEYNRNNFKLM
ncbi:MAG: Crp/Fnr family transcriptional regulator [Defluviitaleaceae bacterium]|nr:Crp/Fnr family transcriptional regulator [Defluviitaleaceae bacterium]MCL2262870.1 Crp/Fnr family transcriptional regulator [Defluviitaleaceae bacterium]